MNPRRSLVIAAVIAIGLVGIYLGLGGGSYTPAAVANPCLPRPWHPAASLVDTTEQLALAGIDGAACRLGVSRETLVLAFRSRAALSRFAGLHHLSTRVIDAAIRDGLRRSIAAAATAGVVTPLQAIALTIAVNQLHLQGLITVLQGTNLNWG
jgi:hypothetical protein